MSRLARIFSRIWSRDGHVQNQARARQICEEAKAIAEHFAITSELRALGARIGKIKDEDARTVRPQSRVFRAASLIGGAIPHIDLELARPVALQLLVNEFGPMTKVVPMPFAPSRYALTKPLAFKPNESSIALTLTADLYRPEEIVQLTLRRDQSLP